MSPILQSLANGSARGYGAFFGAAAAGAYESIASATGTGSSGTITFSSIPSTYQSLQLRISARNTTGDNMGLRINGDTGTNYVWHRLRGTGAAASADSATAANNIFFIDNGGGTYHSVFIIDIHNYTSTTQNKTVRAFSGLDENGGGSVVVSSGLWLSTAAVTSLTFKTETSGNFNTASQFSLYGIKGA